jgi:NADH:ubiquinone oxidoreductase subunit F (NADH-binding)
VGCFELPFGTTLRQLLEVCGGGMADGASIKGIQVGGPLTGLVPTFYLDLAMEPEVYRENKLGSLGGGGFVFLGESACVIDLLSQIHWFLEDESCGRCTTCHGGTQRMVEILRRIQRGGGRESDIGKMRLLTDTLRYANCQHGQLMPVTILHTLEWFAAELEEHIFERRCRARVCKGLVRFEADREAAARPEYAASLANAAEHCLTNAVNGSTSGDPCLNCVVCHELLPDLVQVVDAFEPGLGPAPELISIQPSAR